MNNRLSIVSNEGRDWIHGAPYDVMVLRRMTLFGRSSALTPSQTAGGSRL